MQLTKKLTAFRKDINAAVGEIAKDKQQLERSLRAQLDLTHRNADLTDLMNRTVVERQDLLQQLETLVAENQELQQELRQLQPVNANNSPSNSANSSR